MVINQNGAKLGFENQLWAAADKLRGHMDASEYKHVVLGLIFLKYISDAFEAKYKELEATKETDCTDPEDRDEYAASNVFWVPKEARWGFIQKYAKSGYTDPGTGKKKDIAIYGQESNPTTWKLAKMNLAIRGIEANLGPHHADSFHNDLHKDLRADFLLANPPFNMSDWGGARVKEDVRWKYGLPPVNNANYAWIQHFMHHLSPNGIAGFVMANGSMSTSTSSEGEIRKNMIEADLIDCMIALPGQLFYTTQIPVCLWFVTRNKKNGKFRDRTGETLFIETRNMGALIDRVHRELSDEDIHKIAGTYHACRGEKDAGEYEDVPGFCKSANIDEIKEHGYVLTPGRHVGAAAVEDDGVPFEEKMAELSAKLYEQFAEADKLEAAIKKNLEVLGFGGQA